MSIAPGRVLIRPGGRERRPAAGGRLAPRHAFKSGFKAGRTICPAPTPSPTRPPPISRDTSTTVAAAHTLTRVGGAKPPRDGCQPPHSEDGQRSPPLWVCGDSLLHTFPIHLARRCPGTAAIRTRPSTRRHARGSSEDGGSEAVLQEIWRRPQRCMNKSATSILLGGDLRRGERAWKWHGERG